MPNGPEEGVIFGDESVACTASGLMVWPKAAKLPTIKPRQKTYAIERRLIVSTSHMERMMVNQPRTPKMPHAQMGLVGFRVHSKLIRRLISTSRRLLVISS